MVADPIMNNADIGRKIRRALGAVWIEVKKRIADRGEPSSAKRPVNDGILFVSGIHIGDVLRIINAADRCTHTHELPLLNQNIPDVPSLTDS